MKRLLLLSHSLLDLFVCLSRESCCFCRLLSVRRRRRRRRLLTSWALLAPVLFLFSLVGNITRLLLLHFFFFFFFFMCAVFFFLLLSSCCCGFAFLYLQSSSCKLRASLLLSVFLQLLCRGCYLAYSSLSLSLSLSLPTSFFRTATLPKRSSSDKSGSEVPW